MERSKEMILHWFSLLSAVAVETIKHHDDEDASGLGGGVEAN